MVRLQARVVTAFRNGFRPLWGRGIETPVPDFAVVLLSRLWTWLCSRLIAFLSSKESDHAEEEEAVADEEADMVEKPPPALPRRCPGFCIILAATWCTLRRRVCRMLREQSVCAGRMTLRFLSVRLVVLKHTSSHQACFFCLRPQERFCASGELASPACLSWISHDPGKRKVRTCCLLRCMSCCSNSHGILPAPHMSVRSC